MKRFEWPTYNWVVNNCCLWRKLVYDTLQSYPTYNRQNVTSFIHECNSEYTEHFEQFQVYRLLTSIKRTSSGSEPIPYWVYKHCAIDLVSVVTHIFNLTLSCGFPPSSWKHSKVTPIPKINPPPPQQLSDLRRIFVTPILSRCFERLFVKYHFFPAMPTSDLKDQFAFRPTGSTTNALVHFFRQCY